MKQFSEKKQNYDGGGAICYHGNGDLLDRILQLLNHIVQVVPANITSKHFRNNITILSTTTNIKTSYRIIYDKIFLSFLYIHVLHSWNSQLSFTFIFVHIIFAKLLFKYVSNTSLNSCERYCIYGSFIGMFVYPQN